MASHQINAMFDLTDKIAVVTGGYGHLGQAMVRSLKDCGALVVVAGRSEQKYLDQFNEQERERIHFLAIDLMDRQSIEDFFKGLASKYGDLNILINAHSAKSQAPQNLSEGDWAPVAMEAMVGSVHRMIRFAREMMKKNQSGKIINIASMYGLVSPDFKLYQGDGCEEFVSPPHYGAAKAAIIQLTKYYAVLLGKENIQVNAISPGPLPKDDIQEKNKIFIERLKAKNPLNRIGKPEDLSGVAVLLSSEASDFITGQTIQVDGGWTIW